MLHLVILLILIMSISAKHVDTWQLKKSDGKFLYLPSDSFCKDASVFIAHEHRFLGEALKTLLRKRGFTKVLRDEKCDFTNLEQTLTFFENNRPEYVFIPLGPDRSVGYVKAFPQSALEIEVSTVLNILKAAHKNKVRKLLILIPSSIYASDSDTTKSEDSDLVRTTFRTAESLDALCHLFLAKMAQAYKLEYGDNFIIGIYSELYGQENFYDFESSRLASRVVAHIVSNASSKKIFLSGDEKQLVDLLWVNDCAAAALKIMERYNGVYPINIGSGTPILYGDLAKIAHKILSPSSEVEFNKQKKESTIVLDTTKITKIGWKPHGTIQEYLSSIKKKMDKTP